MFGALPSQIGITVTSMGFGHKTSTCQEAYHIRRLDARPQAAAVRCSSFPQAAMPEAGCYTPKLQKRTLKGHGGPVLCLAHSSERLVAVRDRLPRRRHRRHPTSNDADAKSTTTTTSAIDYDDAEHENNSDDRSSSHVRKTSNDYHPSLLLSGSEDGTVRLWDLRTRKTSICINMPSGGVGNEVTSVAFHPLLWDEENEDYAEGEASESEVGVSSDVRGAGAGAGGNAYTIYASTSNFVYGYDLRHYDLHHQQEELCNNNIIHPPSYTTMRIIHEPPHFDLTPLFQCTDEINQLSFTFRRNVNFNTPGGATAATAAEGRDSRYDIIVSAADDSGEVHIIANPPSRRYCGPTITSSVMDNNILTREYMTSDNRMKPTILPHAEPQTLGIASCASFQPISSTSSSSSSSSLLLATGGTDCTVKLWDVGNSNYNAPTTSSPCQRRKHRKQKPQVQPKLRKTPPLPPPPRLTSTMTISPYETSGSGDSGGDSGKQLCNPPYIHSLSWSASGKLLAAGIGDGSVAIYRVEGNKTLAAIGRLGRDTEDGCNTSNNHGDLEDEETRAGHGSAVASVRFANFGGGRRRGGGGVVNDEEDDRLLLSAGNDGTIIFWDLGGNMVGRRPLDPMRYLLRTSPAFDDPIDDDDDDDDGDDFTPSPSRALFKIAHRRKPNWMTCSPLNNDNNACLPGTIFVADVTKDISAYTLAEI